MAAARSSDVKKTIIRVDDRVFCAGGSPVAGLISERVEYVDRATTRYQEGGSLGMCVDHYIEVIIALFDPLFERIVYVTNSLVDEGRKVGGRPYTSKNPVFTRA